MRLALSAVCAMLCTWSLYAGDVRFIRVAKTVYYKQATTATPALQDNPYEFCARVDLNGRETVSGVTVKWPQPSSVTRTVTNFLTYWEFSQRFPTSTALNISDPNGAYTVSMIGATDGQKTTVLTLSADTYPNPIRIANLPAAQLVNPKTDFGVAWDTPGGADMIQLRVFSGEQLVYETGYVPGALGTLSGTAVSAVIPRGTLREGASYRGQVIVTRRSTSDSTGYPGVPSWGMYSRSTEFPIGTVYATVDLSWYGIARLRRFNQDSVIVPVPQTAGGYGFWAVALATDALNVQSAVVKLGNGSLKNLSAAGPSWNWNESFNALAQLDSSYPVGSYELQIQTTHNGLQKLSLPLSATQPPAPLQIANWNAASMIDPAKPFSLNWLAPIGGTADDFLQVTVRKVGQTVFRTGDVPGGPGSLDGRSTGVTFPAGLLGAGDSAEVTLLFLKRFAADSVSYPQVLGFSGYGSETRAVIRASGLNITPPVLSGAALRDGVLEVNVSATAGRLCVLQSSTDLRNWTDTLFTNAPASSFLLRLPTAAQPGAFAVRLINH